jgi:hypothetical protein
MSGKDLRRGPAAARISGGADRQRTVPAEFQNSARRSLGPIDLFVETFVGLWFVANETFLGH